MNPGTQEVYSDHVTEGDQNIFLLRIKKKAEYSEQKDRNVELELRTPKPPIPPISSIPSEPASIPKTETVTDVDVNDKIEKKLDVIEEIPKQPAKKRKVKGNKKRK